MAPQPESKSRQQSSLPQEHGGVSWMYPFLMIKNRTSAP
jgi:hypothetical protein